MLKLYTDDYIALNADLHKRRPLFGCHGAAWVDVVAKLAELKPIRSVLDFGCGKATFGSALKSTAPNIIVTNYDPAIAKYNSIAPLTHEYDLVVCTDVLEHVELDYVVSALRTISGCIGSGGCALLHISLQQSKKTLSDGRNCHVTVQPASWWMHNIKDSGLRLVSGVCVPGRSVSVIVSNNKIRIPDIQWLADNMPAKILGNPKRALVLLSGSGMWLSYAAC